MEERAAFGRLQSYSALCSAERNAPLSLLCLHKTINFDLAASSKDAAHARAKLDHYKSKLSLTSLSPGQVVYLQDSKSSTWDKGGIIVSVRPDRLSYLVNVDNQFFTHLRRLIRPVTPDTPFPVASSTPLSFPLEHRHYLRLQSRANSAVLQSSCSTVPPQTSSSLSWHPFLRSYGQQLANDIRTE